jgi:hypothetical protein
MCVHAADSALRVRARRRSDTVPALWVAPGVIAVIAPPRPREGTVALSVCALRAAAGDVAGDAAAHAQPAFAPLCAPVAFEYREAWRGAPESASGSAFCAPQPAQSHISFAGHPCAQLQLQPAPAAAPLPVPLMSLFQAAHAA